MGSIPVWYTVLRAAKYLGVAPWELEAGRLWWMNLALAAEGAEARAEEQRAKRKRGRKSH